jgi:indole-3-glycerol phosphate synthase
MSVLTEADHFRGELGFLDACVPAGLPLLRKDFVLHPLQVRQTAATPASAVLLIARMVGPAELGRMVALARELGLEPVVEVFDGDDLARARGAGADLIQVNNRNLDTLEISLDISRGLAAAKLPGETWISASGITRGAQIAELAALGYDAVLVGTFLMEGADPGAALARLIEEKNP